MANEAEFISPLKDKNRLLFRRMLAREELGRLSEYRIELLRVTDKTPVLAESLLGHSASVSIRLAGEKLRFINGIVTRFEQGGVSGRYSIYHVELRPWLWHLTLASDCRIFQTQSAVDIIKAVFSAYTPAGIVDELNGTFAPRPYTVQYRETDFNFVSRLMEEEGIYYYFVHDRDHHRMVLCNSPSGHEPIPGGTLLWADLAQANATKENIVTHWSHAHTVRSLGYAHTDFAAEAPNVNLMATATRTAPYPKPNPLQVYNYPGGHDDGAMGTNTGSKVSEGERTAKFRVEGFESTHSVAAGVTAHRTVTVGSTFEFDGYGKADDGGYLVTSSVAEMEFAGYEANDDAMSTSYSCRFDAVPKSVRFRPRRVAEVPMVRGPQTATVVGASGDEILTDKYGRVKLQFHWDRQGKHNADSSCWVRVSHPWASKQFGMVALPRVGDEVVVDFLEGNPDRPLVTGRVYNGDNMPPWALPAQATVSGIKSRSSKGGGAANFNELRFDDKKGSEYVWLQAEKDFHRLVKNDAFDTVKNNQHVEIVKNSSAKVGENVDTTIGKQVKLKIGTDAHVDIGGDWLSKAAGALGLQVTGAVAIKGAQAIAITSGQGFDLNVGQGVKMSANATVHIKATAGVVIDGGATLTIKAGAGSVVLGPDGVSITGPLVKINSGGSPGAASAAAPASPPAPQAPKAPDANTDPLA